MKLYDTKTGAVRPLEPVRRGHVGIYLCGPTVQGSPHIGHLRAAVGFDVLVRWLRRSGFEVTYIRNITDIDDKILLNADQSGEQWWKLAARFEREFNAAYQQLGLLAPTYEPRATGHITDQIDLVQRLLDAGHAYADDDGNVYFDVHSQPDYGSLTHQRLEDMRSTEDPAQESDAFTKRDQRDFALWKAAKPGEPWWQTPWGRGRPGWHLECSAMAHRYLGETFDIHGGGLDLRFPHHENEQAQSHGAGWGFAQMWVHNAWVTMAEEKMSKSIGNTLSLQNLLVDHQAVVIRLALGTVHYRSMIEWSNETLERAAEVWDRLSGFVADAAELVGMPEDVQVAPADLPERFVVAMDDDLNVAAAMAVVYEHLKEGRRALATQDRQVVSRELKLVRSMLDVLGIDPGSWQSPRSGDDALKKALDVLIADVIEARNAARVAKDWEAADKLRDRLSEAGITLEDGASGSSWRVG